MKKCSCENNGKKGGLINGKSHLKGGVKAVITDNNKPIEVEGGEAIISKEAVKKFWAELSRINQAGGGVPIHKPIEKTKFKKGGNVSGQFCETGMHTQTILFDKAKFSLKQAKAWLKEHGFKTGLDEGVTVYRFRQENPHKFNKNSFKSKKIKPGINMVFGCLLEKFNEGGNVAPAPNEPQQISNTEYLNQINLAPYEKSKSGKITNKTAEAIIRKIKHHNGFRSNGWSLEIAPSTLPYREVIKKIDKSNFYIATKATFKNITKGDTYNEISKQWEQIKTLGEHKNSPQSSSEYVISKNGDVYRFSDHWGRVASCLWELVPELDSRWEIGLCNLSNFESYSENNSMGGGGMYVAANPEFVSKYPIVMNKIKEDVLEYVKNNKKNISAGGMKIFDSFVSSIENKNSYENKRYEEIKEMYEKDKEYYSFENGGIIKTNNEMETNKFFTEEAPAEKDFSQNAEYNKECYEGRENLENKTEPEFLPAPIRKYITVKSCFEDMENMGGCLIFEGSKIHNLEEGRSDIWEISCFEPEGVVLKHSPNSPLSATKEEKKLSFQELKELFEKGTVSIPGIPAGETNGLLLQIALVKKCLLIIQLENELVNTKYLLDVFEAAN